MANKVALGRGPSSQYFALPPPPGPYQRHFTNLPQPDFHSHNTDATLLKAITSVVQQNTIHHQNNHSQFIPFTNINSSKWRKICLTFLVAGGIDLFSVVTPKPQNRTKALEEKNRGGGGEICQLNRDTALQNT
jgi:hypothetical protein